MSARTLSRKTSKAKYAKRSFHQELVLKRWMLGFFMSGNYLKKLFAVLA
jgi:hypothetical protein